MDAAINVAITLPPNGGNPPERPAPGDRRLDRDFSSKQDQGNITEAVFEELDELPPRSPLETQRIQEFEATRLIRETNIDQRPTSSRIITAENSPAIRTFLDVANPDDGFRLIDTYI